MFGIIGWIIFGLVVGALAKLVMPGRDPGGCLVTILLGIAGAVIGGFLGRSLGFYGPDRTSRVCNGDPGGGCAAGDLSPGDRLDAASEHAGAVGTILDSC